MGVTVKFGAMDVLSYFCNARVEFWAWTILNLALGFVISYFLASFLMSLVRRYIASVYGIEFVTKSLNKVRFSRPLTLVFLGWFWLFGFQFLSIPSPRNVQVIVLAKVLTYLGFTLIIWLSADLIRGILVRSIAKKSAKVDALLTPLITRIVHIIAIVFGALSLAEILHFPITSLLTGLGIGGVALAMAAKETLANLFGSMAILTDRPFQIGDWIKVGTHEGIVEEFGLRSTRLRTAQDSILLVPNSTLLTTPVDNLGARLSRRLKVGVHLDLSTTSSQITSFLDGLNLYFSAHPEVLKVVNLGVMDVTPQLGISVSAILDIKGENLVDDRAVKNQLLIYVLQLASSLSISLFKI